MASTMRYTAKSTSPCRRTHCRNHSTTPSATIKLTAKPIASTIQRSVFITSGHDEAAFAAAIHGLSPIGLTLVMILAAVFHIVRREYNFLFINVVLGGVAAFIAYGRLIVRPIAPSSISSFHVLKGLAAAGALVLVGFAPAWYRLAHIH